MTSSGSGYYKGRVRGVEMYAHRAVWFLRTGEWPDVIDHADGNGLNNSTGNLRNGGTCENIHNIPARGYDVRKGRYRVRIKAHGTVHHIGMFGSPEEARAAYLEAKRIHHPTAPERCYQ